MNGSASALAQRAGVGVATAAVAAAGLRLLGFDPWSLHDLSVPSFVSFLFVAGVAGLCVSFDVVRPSADSNGSMRLAFVASMSALLLRGPLAGIMVAGIGALADAVVHPRRANAVRLVPLDVATAIAAAGIAALAYARLSAVLPQEWPWPSVPIIAAVMTYSVITCAVADFVCPLVSGFPSPYHWPRQSLRSFPEHVIGATVAVGLTAVIQVQAWPLLLSAALPLYIAWDAYRASMRRLGSQDRRLDVTRSTDHGVCRVDDDGVVRSCNEAMARLLERSVAHIVDRSFASAAPALAKSELAIAVKETLATRTPRTLSRVSVVCGSTPRVLSASVLPDSEGALIVCSDVTDQARWERSHREYAERFAIVAEAANDGMWELDLVKGTLFVSSRWRTLVGLPAVEDRTTRDAWLARVHASDVPELDKAIATLRDGSANRFELKHRLRHEDGTFRSVVCRAVAVHDASGKPVRVGGSMTDVTEDAIAQAKIISAESRDALTGLLNRAAFVADLGRRLTEFREKRGNRFATLYLDLDRFKVINDSLGHLVGDELLVEVSRRLETCLRPGDAIARLGGDEFAILLHGLGDEMQANVIAFRLQEALNTPFPIDGRDVVTSASIGIAFCRPEYISPEELMRDADTAMYHAKARGKARHELFDADMHARAIDRLGLESDLRQAVKNCAFEVHYQPIVSLSTRMCTGFESLVRWNRNGKPVSPAEFVPMAEELGIIEPLGSWVLQEACRTFVDWQHRFPECQLEYITVNVSARQLVQQGFIYLVEQVVEQNEMNPADLRLEITETALMDAPQFAAQVLSELREFGVKIYLDDFGTGYSSLSHLHKLPVDALKIDRSFVRGLLMTDRPAIVESILALARTLHTNVVAEGIEDEMQATELERLGCSLAQGYYFSRPVSAAAIEALLTAGLPLGGTRAPVAKPVRRPMAAVRAREIA